MIQRRKITFINSQLYTTLLEEGKDELISVYSILKYYKKGHIKYKAYKAKNGRTIKGYSLLHKRTGISLRTLKKYCQVLIDLGILRFELNGDVSLLGGNKINTKYHNKKGAKYVPIEISSYIETKLNSYYIRVYANEQAQKNRIDKIHDQNKILSRLENNMWLPEKNFVKALALQDAGVTCQSLTKNYIDKTVLSNCGFGKLKTGERNKPTKGEYWKRKLLVNGKIASRRSLEKIKDCSYGEYLHYKYQDRKIIYDGKSIYKESVAQFTTTPEILLEDKVIIPKQNKKEDKPLQHLSFDVIHWWGH